jgi:hypothetical protein
MSPLIHLVTAWVIAIIFSSKLKDRRIIVLCGIIPDIDGVFILFSTELFIRYHHGFGHSYIFGIPLILILSYFSSEKLKTILFSIISFSSHLILDIIGTDWAINPLYPFFYHDLKISHLISTQTIYLLINPIYAIIILIIMALITIERERSPMEFISVKLDKIFSGFFVYPMKYKCKICNKRASYFCEVCNQYFCARHVTKYFATRCKDCEKK